MPPRRLDDNDNNDPAHTAVTPAPKRRKSLRNLFDTCEEITGLEREHCCSGCIHFKDFGTKPRTAYSSEKYKCYQVWKRKKVPPNKQKHRGAVCYYIENKLEIAIEALQKEDMEIQNADAPEAETTTTTTAATTISPPETEIRMLENTFRSYGKSHTFWLPHTHKIVHRDHNKRIENDSEMLARVIGKIQSPKFTTDSIFAQTLFGIAMASAPALALSAAQHLMPIFMMAFFYDTGLFKSINVSEYVTSFPSDWLLRKYNLHQATRDTIALGRKLIGKRMCLACDKGNKKGVGHFVKALSWWTPTGRVQVQVLDIDASGGKTGECALAIQASMNKLKSHDDALTHLLAGQSTDSGGGGALENLADEMRALNLLWLHNYLVANCTIHALQLQLNNGIRAALGEGGLENVNVMQMMHSVYRLQESIDLKEWRHMLCLSSEFVYHFDPSTATDVVAEPEDDAAPQDNAVATEESAATSNIKKKKKRTRDQINAANKASFMSEFKIIFGFHTAFKTQLVDPTATTYKETILAKMTQPILARWWTVGSAASYVFDYYLQIFHAAQTVINIYPSGSTPHDIASDLFAMMKDQHNFIDMCLVRTFNKAYLNPHLDWLQGSVDLTEAPGFQSHHIAMRHFVMDQDLHSMLSRRTGNDYLIAVARGNKKDEALHLKKLDVFGKAASESLWKHFDRWLKPALLPAALMAEAPIANVFAAVILQTSPTHGMQENRMSGKIEYKSSVHGRTVDLKKLHAFLINRIQTLEDDTEHTEESRQASNLVINGADMRSFDYTGHHGTVRLDMHSTYLPLASQTQFVEAIVKDAKHVAQTDRSEQHRSWLAIIRSATPLTKADKDANAEKIKGIVSSALDRAAEHTRLIRTQVNNEHNSWFAACAYSLSSQGHFEQDRIDAKKTKVDTMGSKFKKPNQAQKTKQQHLMPAVTGLVPCGKLVKSRHMEDLKTELLYRGVKTEDVPKKITNRKQLLQELELNRLIEEGMEKPQAATQAKKHFKVLSTAPFKLVE